MYAVYYNLEDSNIGNVYMYHETENTDLGTEVDYRIVENIPDSEYRDKVMARLFINLESRELYYEYIERPLTREEQLEEELNALKKELMRVDG